MPSHALKPNPLLTAIADVLIWLGQPATLQKASTFPLTKGRFGEKPKWPGFFKTALQKRLREACLTNGCLSEWPGYPYLLHIYYMHACAMLSRVKYKGSQSGNKNACSKGFFWIYVFWIYVRAVGTYVNKKLGFQTTGSVAAVKNTAVSVANFGWP